MRCTIITQTDFPEERATVEAWFTQYANEIAFIGENEGCGCCVNIWKVDATVSALSVLPSQVRSYEPEPAASPTPQPLPDRARRKPKR